MAGTYAASFSDGITFTLSREEIERTVGTDSPPCRIVNLVTRKSVKVGNGRKLTHNDVEWLSNEISDSEHTAR